MIGELRKFRLCLVGLIFIGSLSNAIAEPAGDIISKFSDQELLKLGEQIFHTPGPNGCMDCHGQTGMGGSRPAAAKLGKPESWRSYKALDGDWSKMEPALLYLIRNGALRWNAEYLKEHPNSGFDWKKAGATRYDSEMFGITQATMQKRLKEIAEELEKTKKIEIEKDSMKDLSAKAVLMYIRTLKVAKTPKAGEKK